MVQFDDRPSTALAKALFHYPGRTTNHGRWNGIVNRVALLRLVICPPHWAAFCAGRVFGEKETKRKGGLLVHLVS